ncbi:dinI-like protein, partial [Escherichia coli 10.0833]
MLRSVSLKKKS